MNREPTKAETNIREIIIRCMMECGEFEPNTREEAERRLDANEADRIRKLKDAFDPEI